MTLPLEQQFPGTVTFEVAGIPIPKGSMKAFNVKGCKYPVVTNDNEQTKPWAAIVQYTARQHRPTVPWEGGVGLHIIFNMRKPKSLPKLRPSWHLTKPDLDKLVRAIQDALKGVFYLDDSQVIVTHSFKRYSDNPGVRISVSPFEIERDWNLLELMMQ